MKIILAILVFTTPFIIIGQNKKIFLDKFFIPTDSLSAEYVSVNFKDTINGHILNKTTTLSGIVVSESDFLYNSNSSNEKKMNLKLEGSIKNYYENGKIKNFQLYKESQLNGELISYYSSGKLRRRDFYENGKLLKGNCYTESGQDTLYFDFRITAKYPGGDKGISDYISTNVIYPKKAKKRGIEGTVYVHFAIDKNGKVVNAKIAISADPLLDEEALRVVKNMGDWSPCIEDGEVVSQNLTLPIRFKL